MNRRACCIGVQYIMHVEHIWGNVLRHAIKRRGAAAILRELASVVCANDESKLAPSCMMGQAALVMTGDPARLMKSAR